MRFSIALVVLSLLSGVHLTASEALPPIDRRALVMRHNPVLHQLDPENPLSVGNGNSPSRRT